jgi:hypothetical protein
MILPHCQGHQAPVVGAACDGRRHSRAGARAPARFVMHRHRIDRPLAGTHRAGVPTGSAEHAPGSAEHAAACREATQAAPSAGRWPCGKGASGARAAAKARGSPDRRGQSSPALRCRLSCAAAGSHRAVLVLAPHGGMPTTRDHQANRGEKSIESPPEESRPGCPGPGRVGAGGRQHPAVRRTPMTSDALTAPSLHRLSEQVTFETGFQHRVLLAAQSVAGAGTNQLTES